MKPQEIGVRTVRAILKEMRQHTPNESDLLVEVGGKSYEFTVADGRLARGEIHEMAAEPLVNFLSALSGCGVFKRLTLDEGIREEISVTQTTRGYLVRCFGEIKVSQESIVQKSNVVEFPTRPVVTSAPAVAVSLNVPEPKQSASGGAHILVIDDNSTFVRVLQRFFSRHEITIEHAADGKQAIDLLRSSKRGFDLAVCDVHMPGVSGFEFLRHVRSDSSLFELPVIMLTSDSDIEVELKLLSEGADAFISKSADPRLLCVQVKRLVERSRTRSAA